jgi:hypothetical protein
MGGDPVQLDIELKWLEDEVLLLQRLPFFV